jgi:hypothetical protein
MRVVHPRRKVRSLPVRPADRQTDLRISQPTPTGDGPEGPRTTGSATSRVQALANMLYAVTSRTNKSLRSLMTGPLGKAYSMNQASYDLARLPATS